MIGERSNEVTIFYNSAKDVVGCAQRLAYSLPGYEVRTVDLAQQNLSESDLAELAGKAGSTIDELLDTNASQFEESVDDLTTMDPYAMLKIMAHQPSLVRTPIIVLGTRAFVADTSFDLVQKEIGILNDTITT